MNLLDLLHQALRAQASDLHLSAGLPPMARVRGGLTRLHHEALSPEGLMALLSPLMSTAQLEVHSRERDLDFACEVAGLSRLRVNVFHQLRGPAAVMRLIPSEIRPLEQLNAPPIVAELALLQHGLLLFTGPTGSGKTTLMASVVDHRNRHHSGHILTLEDPIEFIHQSRRSLVNQREVGSHAMGFAQALRSALREDPDVILVGELRDLETMRLALTAAETGHLVLATLHAGSAVQSVDRMIDVFPAGEKAMVRAMLSESLQGVIAQTLCTTIDGRGRTAALEIMVGTPAIRNLIREGKAAQMISVMQSGSGQGMQTLDQHLTTLVRRGLIAPDEARRHARYPENFR